MQTIYYFKDASAGSGKTQGAIALISEYIKQGRSIIYASKTITLLEQTYSDCVSTKDWKTKLDKPPAIDPLDIIKIWSGEAVAPKTKLLATLLDGSAKGKLIITTHQSLLAMQAGGFQKDTILFLDEDPATTQPVKITLQGYEKGTKIKLGERTDPLVYLSSLTIDPDTRAVSIKHGQRKFWEAVASGSLDDSFKSKNVVTLAHALVSPLCEVDMITRDPDNARNKLEFRTYTTPKVLAQYKKVILLVANTKDTLTYQLWTNDKTNPVTFHEVQGLECADSGHIAWENKIHLYSLLRHPITSGRHTENEAFMTTVYDIVEDLMCEHGKDFIYCRNSKSAKPTSDYLGLEIPVQSQGKNDWKDYEGMAFLSSFNYDSQASSWFKERGLDRNQLVRTAKLQDCYQGITRIVIRRNDSTGVEDVHIVVPDDETMDYLAGVLTGVTCHKLTGVEEWDVKSTSGVEGGRPAHVFKQPAKRKATSILVKLDAGKELIKSQLQWLSEMTDLMNGDTVRAFCERVLGIEPDPFEYT